MSIKQKFGFKTNITTGLSRGISRYKIKNILYKNKTYTEIVNIENNILVRNIDFLIWGNISQQWN